MENAFDKASLSERDICTQFITPALVACGWDLKTQIREEVSLTDGRILVKGQLAARSKKQKRADYVLYHKLNIPLAVIEAKKNTLSLGAGMQQAIATAEMQDIPYAFSSNGDGFMFHDRTGVSQPMEVELTLDQFPTPAELWQRYCAYKGITADIEPVVAADYYLDTDNKQPRYYQMVAINRVVDAIATGQTRLLLVMATGTGKTFTAFQIIWRLWRSRNVQRVLFLADRNILVNQTRANDFKPFGAAMTKIQNRQVDKSYEIYLSLYQAVSGSEADQNIYRQFSPDFFDLIVIDECHRGSAAEDSAWREILEYFASAVHLGLTATPKETKEVSNIEYFGEPIFTYSLRQGIEDGFLAPYKVIRIDLDSDLEGWRPRPGQRDKYGNEIPDQVYNQREFDRSLVLEPRTELVARLVTDYLKQIGDRYAKTIVFCENIDHAERMRVALVNENADIVQEHPRYVMRITGDNPEGKAQLDSFIDPRSAYPTIVTTSELLTTGVDAKTCKLIVLDQRIQSMTKFKQIIGRGTRLEERYGKQFFTIMDFKQATQLFADPDFDGDPVQIYAPQPTDAIAPPEPDELSEADSLPRPQRYVVDDAQVQVAVVREQTYNPDGTLTTAALRDYTRQAVSQAYGSLDGFLRRWNAAEQKQAILQELRDQGLDLETLQAQVGREYGLFDLICHVAFDQPPLTRRQRAQQVRRDYFSQYGEQARQVLEALLEKYADAGIEDIENINVLRVQPFTNIGTPIEIIKRFNGKTNYQKALIDLKKGLYGVS